MPPGNTLFDRTSRFSATLPHNSDHYWPQKATQSVTDGIKYRVNTFSFHWPREYLSADPAARPLGYQDLLVHDMPVFCRAGFEADTELMNVDSWRYDTIEGVNKTFERWER
jgi:hypothetical protein